MAAMDGTGAKRLAVGSVLPGRPGDPDAVLAGLDPEQREVATATTGPLVVLAGAGTGKTRAITHRIAYGVLSGVVSPQRVLAVTFTARAAGELRTRLRELGVAGVQARTFHAAALRQLTYFWPKAVGGAPPTIVEHKAPLVAEAAARLRLPVDRPAVRDLSAEVEWAKVGLLTPQTYRAAATAAGHGEVAGFDTATVARVLEVYEQVKTDRFVIDFEDVLLLTVGILADRRDIADAVRAQYQHFVVDEYQDVNAAQQRLLELWLGGRDDLCVVGDPSQTIYSFTGASPEHLLGFRRRYPAAMEVRLVRDYRSTPQVVALANALLARRGAAPAAPLQLLAQRPDGPVPQLTAYDDDVIEAGGVAARIATLIGDGVPAGEIAVLYRTNAQAEALEQALAAAGVPYLVRGGERFFQRKEVRDALLLLRGAARSAAASQGLVAAARDVLTGVGWTPEPPSATGAVRERWESLQSLVALAEGLVTTRPAATLADLVTELEERAAAQHAPAVQGVTLASLHAAKGLEWDAVFLVGLAEGLMPIWLAQGWSQIEEERRLLYVGVTRAREHLHLSWARARTPGGRANRNPSRFLEGPVAQLLAAAGGRTPPAAPRGNRPARDGEPGGSRGTRSRPALCRTCAQALATAAERKIGSCSSCPASYDEALFGRLREWRSAAAAEAKVPAYAVFTDATLVAIAEAMPADHAGLARISGVGAAKLERYGAAVLALLAPQ
jgi:DNA helicase II / ATP-dependent DNA helicase PcrA